MGKIVKLYENNPDYSAINQVVDRLKRGAIIIFPTDSFYSFGCSLECQKSINELIELKRKTDKNLSIICSDIKMVSEFIRLDNEQFRILKQNTPKPITFIFALNKRLPNSFFDCKKTVGVRITANPIAQRIVEILGCPLVSTTVHLQKSTKEDSIDPSLIWDEFGDRIEFLIDGGIASGVPTLVVEMSDGDPQIIRNSEVELIY